MRASLMTLVIATFALATVSNAASPNGRRPYMSNAGQYSGLPGATAGARPMFPGVRPGAKPGRPVIMPAPEERRRPGNRHRPPWYPGHGHGHGHGHGDWGRIPWWYWFNRCPHQHGCGNSYWPYGYGYNYSGPFSSTSSPYGMDAYAGYDSGGDMGGYATDSYLYPYDTTGYYMEMGPYPTSVPYYEADPIQYAYTPSDLTPRAEVVRPSRSSPAALIVPGPARMPLHVLLAKSDASDTSKSSIAAR